MSEQRDLEAVAAAKRQRYRPPGRRAPYRPTFKPGEVTSAEMNTLIDGARCAGMGMDFTGVRYQAEAAHLRRELCLDCPVRNLCLQIGRRTWGWGLFQIVLVNGYIAEEEP